MKERLEQWFFGFWVKKYKMSMLLTLLLVLYGIFSLAIIPKESSPDIKFGIIWVTTVYTWVNPTDIDSLITEKIEKEIKDISWIKKITSSSSLGVSQITIELETGVESRNVLVDIKDKVDKVSLPSDAEDPMVMEISTDSDLMFDVYLYAKEQDISQWDLSDKAVVMQKYLESQFGIKKVDISPNPEYELLVAIDKTKLENYGLTFSQVANMIRSYNKNTPIGNYEIGDMKYDFRFDGEFTKEDQLLQVPIISEVGKTITLWNIATVTKDYKSKNIVNEVGFYQKAGYNYVKLSVSKTGNVSIFSWASQAKKLLEERLKQSDFTNIQSEYVSDLADIIIKDYKTLAKNAISTLILVFALLFIFLWFKDAIIATLLIPLAFFCTFIVLNIAGLSLNFLTNFSLLLTLWIALDTIIVVIECASEKMKAGHSPRSAVLLAVNEFRVPLITGTTTTLVVFLPMMLLPWILWKFLAYIPITVFITLLAGLILSLTLNSPIFMLLNKDKKYYVPSDEADQLKTPEELELLQEEREWKKPKSRGTWSFRYKFFGFLEQKYYASLKNNLEKNWFRKMVIGTPMLLLVFSFIFIAPKLGFVMFPSWDNTMISVSVSTKEGTTTSAMKQHTLHITQSLQSIEELKVFSLSVQNEKINVAIELLDKNIRDERGLRNSFEVEKEIIEKLGLLSSYGLLVESQVASWGPPTGSAVWIKLITDSNLWFQELIKVAEEFEWFLKWVDGTKNVKNSSSSTPGQFVFKMNIEKLSSFWLLPNDLLNEIYFLSSGINAGSMKWDYDSHDIVLKISDFENKRLSPSNIMDMEIPTRVGNIKIGSVADYQFLPAISTIQREAGNITISVTSDLEEWYFPTDVQPKLMTFAQEYPYPRGVSYSAWWEAAENAELIQSVLSSFFIAIFLIFTLLVLQFNSFLQPVIILNSIVLALLWVNIWLFLTGNPYSMSFAIWFIALSWIVINNSIILIVKINSNIEKWATWLEAVAESGRSRLRPILLTTLTTLFGILPLALEDEFWAGLWFTIIFGLLFSSVMTLYVTPSLYYSLFIAPKKRFFLIRFVLWIISLIKKIFLFFFLRKKKV